MLFSRSWIAGFVVAIVCCAPAPPARANGYLPGSASESINAGTAIVNQGVATYDDGKGANYYTASNQLVVTTQNAPAVTITGTGSTIAAPGTTVTDLFTVANNGNAAATIQIVNASVTLPNGAASAALSVASATYVQGASYGTPASIDTYNQRNLSIPQGTSTSLQFTYVVPFGTPIGTATTNVTVALVQAAVSGAPSPVAAQKAVASATASDTVTTDAQLDLATTITNGLSTYTIETDVQNSGGLNARGSNAAEALLTSAGGGGAPGAFIVQRVPQCVLCAGAGSAQSTLSGTPQVTTSALNGYAGGAPLVVYNHDGSAKTWDQTPTGTVTYVGVFMPVAAPDYSTVLNGTAALINPSHADGTAGRAPHPAVTIVTTLTYPAGFHSSDGGAYSTISDGIIDGNVQSGGQFDLLGPAFADPSSGNATIDTATADLSAALTNETAQAPVTGASNLAYGSAPASFGVLNGPLGHPDATGILDGGAAASSSGDFTAFVLLANVQGSATQSINTAQDTTTAVQAAIPDTGAYAVENTLRNVGTSDDTFALAAVPVPAPFPAAQLLPAGWTVAFFAANADNSIGTTPITTTPVVHSGDTFNYYAVYMPPKGAQLALFVPYEAIVSATSQASLAHATRAGPAAVSDPTIHVIFVNGFVQITKQATSDLSTCAGNVTHLPKSSSGTSVIACPGASVTFAIQYKNLAPDPAGGGGSGNVSLTAKNFTIVEDGNGTANPDTPVNASNWAQFSSGLAVPATDTGAPVTDAGVPASSARWTGNTVGSTSFTDAIGTLAPQSRGTASFGIVLNAPPFVSTSTPTPAPSTGQAVPAVAAAPSPSPTPAPQLPTPTPPPIGSGGSV